MHLNKQKEMSCRASQEQVHSDSQRPCHIIISFRSRQNHLLCKSERDMLQEVAQDTLILAVKRDD